MIPSPHHLSGHQNVHIKDLVQNVHIRQLVQNVHSKQLVHSVRADEVNITDFKFLRNHHQSCKYYHQIKYLRDRAGPPRVRWLGLPQSRFNTQ